MQRIERLNKADLLWVVRRMCADMGPEGDIKLQRAMSELDYRREQALIKKADDAARRANTARKRIIDILAPYDKMSFLDIPTEVLEQAAAAEQEATAADKEWEKLMGIGRRKR